MSITPLRVGFSPTSVITISEPESDAPAASQNAAADMSPGTARSRPVSRWRPCKRHGVGPEPLDLHAELGQGPLRMVPCGKRFGHRRPASGMKPCQQHGALDLRARDLGVVVQRRQRRCPSHRQGRAAVARLDARAHLLQRHDHAAHGTSLQRGVADQCGRKRVRRQDARQHAHRAARIAGVQRLALVRPGRPARAREPAGSVRLASRGSSSITTPSCRRQASVEAQSPPVE